MFNTKNTTQSSQAAQSPNALPPLLQRFQQILPSDIFSIAAKIHLEAGIRDCAGNLLANAFWNQNKSALFVNFTDSSLTTLLLEGYRLLTKCSCRLWQPARNCPHVVIAWATLKRTVSPESLSHIRFNQQMLSDMKRYLDQEPVSPKNAEPAETPGRSGLEKRFSEAKRKRSEHLNAESSPAIPHYRLLVTPDRYGFGLDGRFVLGNVNLGGWSTNGIPSDLARFMATFYYYESTPRFYESFLKQTKGKYPIVFRDAEACETALVYVADEPRRPGICFDIRGEEVIISRSLDNGIPIPPGSVIHGNLLFDLPSGTIHPLADSGPWRTWAAIIQDLDTENGYFDFDECAADDYDDGLEDEDYWDVDESEPVISSMEIRRLPHAIAAPLSLFNSGCIRLGPDIFDNPDENFTLLVNGIAVDLPQPVTPSYILDLPEGISETRVSLAPSIVVDDRAFNCSNAVFWPLNPANLRSLSAPLRARKRLRQVLETAFALLDESKTTARNAIIRAMTASGEFNKRVVKREAKHLLERLSEEWKRKVVLLLASRDGWQCVEDDRLNQAGLLRILYERFGLDAFTAGSRPGEMELPKSRLLKELPDLVSDLSSGGFSLKIGNSPLASASWEFTLDATRGSMDWFELRPEIRCNGEILNEEELRGLLDGNGMFCRQGRYMLLDESDSKALAMFAGAMPKADKKRSGGNEAVRVPRLQILDWLHLQNCGVSIKLAPEDARVLESLLNFEQIPERQIPSGLNAHLRQYQAESWRWLAFLYEHRFGACLADDMGLGKTLQGITLLAGIISGEIDSSTPSGVPHLVVAPPSLLFNWEAEINRFLPSARICLYTGAGRSIEAFRDHDIVITSYGIVQRDISDLEKLPYDVIIFDETQVVKNLQAATTNAVRRLKGAFVLGLTGTPVENHLREYYAIMDLCLPGLLGSREDFSRQTVQDGPEGAGRLIRRTRPFILRRTKEMIAAELPPKIETKIQLELAPKQKALYQRTVEEVRGQVREAYTSHAPVQARIIALTAILRLRQICLSPALASAGASDTSPKLDFLTEQLTELADEGHSALVFSQFTGYLNLIEKQLVRHGLNCLRLDGSTPVPQRKKLVQAFQNSSEPAVFLISLKAGGRGLNLTRATYVYHMDPWWNPAVENQASDRAHRIGQTGQVTITRLIMRHTIEEKMMMLKEHKLQLYKSILEEGSGGGGAGLTREDFEFLLG